MELFQPLMEKPKLSAADLAAIGAALSSGRKAQILLMLIDRRYSTDEISQVTGWPAPDISVHLKQLHGVGLVMKSQREGKRVYYRATRKAKRLLDALQ